MNFDGVLQEAREDLLEKKEADSPARLLSTSPSNIIINLNKNPPPARPQASAPLFQQDASMYVYIIRIQML